MTDEPSDTTAGWQSDPGTLAFDYTNWRGQRYRYVVDFKAGYNPGPVAYEGADDHRGEPALAGQVITRDGDPRRLLGGGARRRTFLIDHMENVEVMS